MSAPLVPADIQAGLFQHLIFGATPSLIERLAFDVVLVAAVFLPGISLIAMFGIWWERKVAGHMQSRIGPNRVGPIGLLQSIADGVKLLTKEDLMPADADHFLFRLAPYLAFVPPFVAFAALPFGPDMTFEPRLNAGVFWILAVLSVEVVGIILAGWASNNKWSVYGAMREACQMVSYEIPLGLSIIIGIMTAGTLNMVLLGKIQGGGLHTWLLFRNPFTFAAFVVYFIASLASNKRAPFDLPESESELVAGYHTEYSGLRFSFFFFAEYAAMFIVAGIQTALFLGGWNDPFGLIGYYHHYFTAAQNLPALAVINLIAVGIFVTKCLLLVFVQMWLRWTLPRPRIDQVLYTCVKVLLPLACVLLLGAAGWELLVPELNTAGGWIALPWRDYNPFRFADFAAGGASAQFVVQIVLAIAGAGMFFAAVGWILFAAASGRKIKQRLTDPAAIPA